MFESFGKQIKNYIHLTLKWMKNYGQDGWSHCVPKQRGLEQGSCQRRMLLTQISSTLSGRQSPSITRAMAGRALLEIRGISLQRLQLRHLSLQAAPSAAGDLCAFGLSSAPFPQGCSCFQGCPPAPQHSPACWQDKAIPAAGAALELPFSGIVAEALPAWLPWG